MKWKTRDGRQIDIQDMEDGHLLNTIAYLERTGRDTIPDLEVYYSCLEYACSGDTPDGAAMAAMNEVRAMEEGMMPSLPRPEYEAMLVERERRGL